MNWNFLMRKGRNAFADRKVESNIESKCREIAIANGFEFLKNTAESGEMDRFLIGKPIAPEIVFVEMKKPKGVISDIQEWKMRKRKKQGYQVYVIDNEEDFKLLLKKLKKTNG